MSPALAKYYNRFARCYNFVRDALAREDTIWATTIKVTMPVKIELPRYAVLRMSPDAFRGGSGEMIRPERIPPELYQALERALDGEPWRESLARRLREQPVT